MEDRKVQKKNVPYLLGYILVPILVVAVCYLLGWLFFRSGGVGAVICFMGAPILAVAWYCLAGRLIYKSGVKKLGAEMDRRGLERSFTFNGRGCTVIVDRAHRQVGLVFFWNPTQPFIFPAGRIEKTWVDDGKRGTGILAGSSQVSFLFQVDGTTVRVYTFTSNKRWRMDGDYILTGISKADAMVAILDEAREQVN